MAVEDSNIYRQSASGGYVPARDLSNPLEYLRAIDIETGKIVWEVPQVGAPRQLFRRPFDCGGWSSTVRRVRLPRWTPDRKHLVALRCRPGMAGSPMTYLVNGRPTSRSHREATYSPLRWRTGNGSCMMYSRGQDRLAVQRRRMNRRYFLMSTAAAATMRFARAPMIRSASP
jgi:hypothetical protein